MQALTVSFLHDREAKLAEAHTMMISSLNYGANSEVSGAFRVGAELRAARERLGWDLPAVAAGLRIRLVYLEAIEAGELSQLPGNAYAVMFLRTYATSLGLDADETVRRFRAEAAEVNRKTELAFPAPVPERGVPAGALALLGILVAIGAYVGWYHFSGSQQNTAQNVPPIPAKFAPLAPHVAMPPSPQVASVLPIQTTADPPAPPPAAVMPAVPPTQAAAAMPPPLTGPAPFATGAAPTDQPTTSDTASTATPSAGSPSSSASGDAQSASALAASGQTASAQPAASAAPNQGQIVVQAKADSWVQVREKGGHVLFNRVLRPGESWTVPVDSGPLLLTTGNAGGTELLVDGVLTAPLGNNGVVRRDLPLDVQMIKNGALSPQGSAGARTTTTATTTAPGTGTTVSRTGSTARPAQP